ncbi:MAG: hypothetical protein ABI759_21455 [Candidatus Solibacter sp.]
MAGLADMKLTVEAPFDRAVKRVRTALAGQDLEIAGELELAAEQRSRVLLVDCPLLVFAGLALDRAAGVYFPLHVLLVADGRRTQVSTMRLSEAWGVRLPAGAAGPIDQLEARVAKALAKVGGAVALERG